ncbi:unnamed protein product [Caenorhabditis angaria]|uniref:G-protein coupled receptors family 1 profile domain-containing protein n=1 Tax=Caenorhabditis angaria TaxID=860376 RepID=A0A9P1N839_9PELO|nr:unnamed protein product [Caenorhabditis angaria]
MLDTRSLGLLLICWSVLGVVFNWSVVFFIKKLPNLNSSFGILTANQAIGDGIHSLFFLIYASPMIFFDNQIMMEYSSVCGFILLFSYDLSIMSHFLISCNRFCAVYFPIKYTIFFDKTKTYYGCLVVLIISILCPTVLYSVSCRFYYKKDLYMFIYSLEPLCQIFSYYIDFVKYMMIVISIVIIDLCTIFKVRSQRNKVARNINTLFIEKRIREMSFLRQTLFQGSIFVTELITYFIICPLTKNDLLRFWCSMFAWVFVHASDGKQNTYIFCCCVALLSLIFVIVIYAVPCVVYYDYNLHMFVYTNTQICQLFSYYLDFGKYITVVISIVIIDFATLYRVKSQQRKITVQLNSLFIEKRIRENSFLRQTIFQGVLFTTELITYFIISPKVKDDTIRLCCTLLAWVTVHASDGAVTLICNIEFRKFIESKIHKILLKMVFPVESTTVMGRVTAVT